MSVGQYAEEGWCNGRYQAHGNEPCLDLLCGTGCHQVPGKSPPPLSDAVRDTYTGAMFTAIDALARRFTQGAGRARTSADADPRPTMSQHDGKRSLIKP